MTTKKCTKKRDAQVVFLDKPIAIGRSRFRRRRRCQSTQWERAKRKTGPTFVFTIGLLCFLSIGPGMEQLYEHFLKSVTRLKAHP